MLKIWSSSGVGSMLFWRRRVKIRYEPLVKRLRIVKNDLSLTIEKEADEEDFYIDTLCVDPAYHRQGIGTSLIQFVEQYANENGYERLSLVVEQNNTKAQKTL